MTTIGIPTIVTSAGATPATPQALQTTLLANAVALQPGLTGNLPATLIEDIASTDVGALMVADSGYVDLINSISPTTANPFILIQQGALFGVPQGIGSNGSVFVVFNGPAGFPINAGFQVTDGTNQYTVQDGGSIATGGQTAALFCVAVQSGTFAIPANTVNQLVTSVPAGYTVTCNNPTAGLPQTNPQTLPEYQAQVIQAWQATAQGMPQALKTQLAKVVGISPRLVSVQQNGSQWTVMVGGGDPYQVGYAIYLGIADLATLTGCSLGVAGITNASPGVVTTNIAHGYTTGQVVFVNGATGISGINGVAITATVLGPYTFSIGYSTVGDGTYTGGGSLTPNFRNQTIAINDYPDTYTIPFVVPLQQLVTIALTWNTQGLSFVNSAAVAALAIPALVAYVNSIAAGSPMNVFEMQNVFQEAVTSILPTVLITRMIFTITVNGVGAAPTPGSGIIPGDAFSYFEVFNSGVTVVQG
jgi:Ubiquitin-activating enzyme E1 FCCH domain